MTIQEGIELFRTHQKTQEREKTRESYAYLLRNFETRFGETMMDAICAEDIHQFLVIVTDSRARSSARLRYAQLKGNRARDKRSGTASNTVTFLL